MAEQVKEPYNSMVDKKFLGEWDLDNGQGGWGEKNAIVLNAYKDSVTSEKGTAGAVVAMTSLGKGFVVNGHNRDVLIELTGSKYPADWNNVPITFYVNPKVRAFGKTVAGLRIKKQKATVAAPPAPKPTLVLGSEQFDKAKLAVEAGTFDLEKLKSYYTITEEVQTALNL